MGKAVKTNADNLGYLNPPNVYRPAILDIELVGEYNPNDGAINTYRITQNDGKIFEFDVKNGSGGSQGVSIVSVEQIETSYESRGENKIRVTFSDGTTSDFIVRNGGQGEKGDTGERGPVGVETVTASIPADDTPGTPSVTPSYDPETGEFGLAFEHLKGVKGDSVDSVTQPVVSTENGGYNTIRVNLDNGDSFDFQVRNGKSSAGFFEDAAALTAAGLTPNVGDYCFVSKAGDGTFPAYIYVCETAGTWTATTNEYDGDSVDLTPYATKEQVSELGQIDKEIEDTIQYLLGMTNKAVNGIISSDGTWVYMEESDIKYQHIVLAIKKNDEIVISAKNNASCVYALLTDLKGIKDRELAHFVSGTSRSVISAGDSLEITATSDLYLYICIYSENIEYTPKELTINGYSIFIGRYISTLLTKTSFLNGKNPHDYNINARLVSNFYGLVTGETLRPISNIIDGQPAASVALGYIGADGRIQSVQSGYEHYIIPIYPGDTVKMKPGATTLLDYAVLKSYDPYAFCSSITGRQRVAAGSAEQTLTVPSDAFYLVITKKYDGAEWMPDYVKVNEFNAISGVTGINERVTTLEHGNRVFPFLKYIASTNTFEFFSKAGERYASFVVQYAVDNEIKEKVWRLTAGYMYDSSLNRIATIIASGENEFTAMFSGFGSFQGFTGGYHGGELLDGDANCFVKFFADGKVITDTMMASDFEMECSSFRYIQYSTLNKVNDSGGTPISGMPIFAHHLKDVTFEAGEMKCKNVVTFSDNVSLYEYFSGLFCTGKGAASYCVIPTGIEQQLTGGGDTILATNKFDGEIQMYNPTNDILVSLNSKYVHGLDENANKDYLVEQVWDRSLDSKYYRFILKEAGIPVESGHTIETQFSARFI